jgi:membrane protein DedA with SNARE-associated domain
LFLRHGGKVVFIARFIALLRMVAAILAGVNRMPWSRFVVADAAGGILWATIYGYTAYSFGSAIFHAHGPLGLVLLCCGLIAVVLAVRYLRSHEAYLQIQAEQALPGPIRAAE